VLSRVAGATFAVIVHLALAVTVWFLFPFLMGLSPPPIADSPWWPLVDGLLVLQFGVSHSLLLAPPMRERIGRVLPSALHGCLFCLTTSLSLLLLMFAWRRSAVVVWDAACPARWAVIAAYALAWVGLFYTLGLTGYGWQTGWTPFWAWFRGERPLRRQFEARGAYRWMRHPTYLAFLGLIWLTPTVTLDRLLMMVLLTAYVAVGSGLKDRRLAFYLGDVYRKYEARVPGYPLVGFGPLGRVGAGSR
jgi:hypothetical protein